MTTHRPTMNRDEIMSSRITTTSRQAGACLSAERFGYKTIGHKLIRRGISFLVALAVIAGAVADTRADEPGSSAPPERPLKAMLVTGGCCHDYDTQRVIVTEGLSRQLGNIDWTIHQYDEKKDTRATVYENPDWADGYDFVVHNECFGDMKDAELIRNIVSGHERSGAAAILIHCSMHSYRNSEAADVWRQFIGVTSTYHEKEKRSLPVIPTQEGRQSKLLASLGDRWDTPNGELYVIKQVWPGTTVLATAFSIEEDADQPVIWRRESGGVRVFGTTLGHHNETVRSEPWQAVVAAGTRWAIGQE
jgi:uncharacterized protein